MFEKTPVMNGELARRMQRFNVSTIEPDKVLPSDRGTVLICGMIEAIHRTGSGDHCSGSEKRNISARKRGGIKMEPLHLRNLRCAKRNGRAVFLRLFAFGCLELLRW